MRLQNLDDLNRGLPVKFDLENGKFKLVGGTEKTDDNIRFLFSFLGWFRLYTPDFVINVGRFFQQTGSFVYRYKNILRLNILEVMQRYLPFVQANAVDILLDYSKRKDTELLVKYQYRYDMRNLERTLSVVSEV